MSLGEMMDFEGIYTPPYGKLYLGNAFSVSMLPKRTPPDEEGSFTSYRAMVKEIDLETAQIALCGDFESIVSHEVTAEILGGIIGKEAVFNRVSVELLPLDTLICFVPQFRAEVAREFTAEEVRESFRIFKVTVKAVTEYLPE